MKKLLAVSVCALMLVGCKEFFAAPGQPPKLGNIVVGLGVIAGDNALIQNASDRVEKAYAQKKIEYAAYVLLREEIKTTAKVFYDLGVSIMNNDAITQEQVTKAELEFLKPLQANLVKYLGPPSIPETQPQR